MFSEDSLPQLPENSAILTVHSMEQLGKNFSSFLSRLKKSNAKLIVHLEPITEFYDHDNFYDKLAYEYSLKRNYLHGYLKELRRLESKKEIEILDAFRPQIGGIVHESSIIVWRLL